MKFYDEKILPRLIDFACGMGQVMKTRAQVVPLAEGRVLEIGIGTGLNLSFYDHSKVSAIVGVDPAAQMQSLARQRAEGIDIPALLAAGGFRIKEVQSSYLPGPRPMTWVWRGWAC